MLICYTISMISKILWTIFGLGLAALALVLILVGFNLGHVASIYTNVNQGKSSLEQALNKAEASDFHAANQSADLAVNSFSKAAEDVKAIRLGPLAYIKVLSGYKTDAEHLVVAGKSLAEAMTEATAYAYDLGDIIKSNSTVTFSQLPSDERRRILASIYNADQTLNSVNKHLDESLVNLQGIKSFDWFGPLSVKLEELKDKVGDGQKTISEAQPLTRLLPPMLGYPDTARYLLILQNSDELRPTGGFIGTYGIIQTKDGDFERFETHDIYHLDMPVKDKISIAPPAPLKQYLGVDKWYMRDSNWAPDWPSAAQTITDFYKKENAAQVKPDPISEFDGVIAITPELIIDLMKFTGPVTIGTDTYTPENFVDLLQYKVERGFEQLGVSSWQRKEVVGEIAKVIKQRLVDMPLGRWPQMINIVSDNVARKNILLYSRNADLQNLIREQGWSGEVRHDWGDYLMVVDANMAALKTDAVIDRQISYRLEETENGLKAIATLRYSHNGSFDWKTTRYRSYTRIFVPQGSHLLKVSGYSQGAVATGDEFGKTWFGAFLSVEPGQIGEMVFEYELPKSMFDNMRQFHNYRLTIQKQPGKQVSLLNVDLGFKNEIKSYEPASFYTETADHKKLNARGDLKIDRSFLVKF